MAKILAMIIKTFELSDIHCEYCKERNPESGFYPMIIGHISPNGSMFEYVICNDCDRKLRESSKSKGL